MYFSLGGYCFLTRLMSGFLCPLPMALNFCVYIFSSKRCTAPLKEYGGASGFFIAIATWSS